MSRSSYGYVGRRSGGAAWQWVVIGMVLGFSCSVVLVLAGLAGGFLSLDPNAVANAATQTPFVITATPAPVTPTSAPTEAPPTATQAVQVEVQAPTASPTIEMTFLTLQATSAVTIGTPPASNEADTGEVTFSGDDGFARLISLASDMVPISGGTFQMGTSASEVSDAVAECLDGTTYGGNPGNCDPAMGEDLAPVHSVPVSAFNMEVTEVTYAQYMTFINALGPGSHRNGCDGQACMRTRNESETSNVQFDGANYSVPSVINEFPMANVTWYGAKAYCEALGRRLPTEAEWEHAARGESGTIYPWGNAWNSANASTSRPAEGEPSTVTVFSFPSGQSEYGVLNMAGNVAEWVSDWYDPRFYGRPEATVVDPIGPVSGTEKVVRGGSWDAVPFFARGAHRQKWNPNDPTAWIGFRCVSDGNSQPITDNPLGSNDLGGGESDLSLPTQMLGGSEETTANSQPTLPPAATATQSGPLPTLAPGG